MKKNLFLVLSSLFFAGTTYSQAIVSTVAPLYDGSTSPNRAPNGTTAHTYMRGIALVLGSELTGIAPGTTLTTFGYTLSSGAVTNAATGNYTVYLQNTTDVTYNKGTNFATATGTMTQAYAGMMTIPVSATTTSVTVTLSTPFVYTGGGIYVAYDWYNPGPYSTTTAVYLCNSTGLAVGMASGAGTGTVNTLVTTAYRPCFFFGRANTYVNENSVNGIDAPGKVALGINNTYSVQSVVRNNSALNATNIPVDLNITGANTFSANLTISSLAAGASTTVTFPVYTTATAGTNSITVSIPGDELNTNNQFVFVQDVTCTDWSLNPALGVYNDGVGFNTGSGIIGSAYRNLNTSSLDAIKVGISTDANTVGRSLHAALLSAAGAVIARTNTITITAGDLGTVKTFSFATSQNLSASTNYFLGLAQPANTTGYFPIGSYYLDVVPFSKYATFTLTGGTPAPLTSNLGYFKIEGIFKPIVNITVNSGAICAGQSFTIVPTGASTYTYTGGSAVVSPTADASYTVTGTTSNGCVSPVGAVSSVTVNALPTITANSGAICAGSSFTIVPGGASTYTISGGNDVVSPTADATYSVSGTDANGCVSDVDAISSVTVNALPTITANSGAICAGSSFTIVPGGASTYTISGGSDVVSPTADATYSVSGTDANGCVSDVDAISSVTVNALPTLVATTNNTLLCTGQTATLSVTGASTYTWSTNENASDIAVSPTAQTTYTVSGTDANGCENITTIQQDVDLCTGIKSVTNSAVLNIYPNPTSGLLTIELSTSAYVVVINNVGQEVIKENLNEGKYSLDLTAEATGIYFVKVINANSQSVIRINKQ